MKKLNNEVEALKQKILRHHLTKTSSGIDYGGKNRQRRTNTDILSDGNYIFI